MLTRSRWNIVKDPVENGINLENVKRSYFEFLRIIKIRSTNPLKEIHLIVEAKTNLESAIVHLKNLVEPEENIYLKNFVDPYYFMVANLGRWNQRLDKIASEIVHKIDMKAGSMQAKLLRQLLIEGAETLVIGPLTRTKIKFEEFIYKTEYEEIVKDKNLFCYFLFLDLLHSSEVLGVSTRSEGSIKKSVNVAEITPRSIPPVPENVETREVIKEGQPSEPAVNVTDFFSEVNEEESES